MNVSERVGGIRQIIAETLCAIPEPVTRFAIRRITFQTTGVTSSGVAMNRRHLKPWLIVLDERMPMRGAHGIVAHEIAHCWLRHEGLEIVADAVEAERAACALVAEWGFSGLGAEGEFQAANTIERRRPNTSSPPGTLRFEDDEVRMRCDGCGQDADLFVQTFDTKLRGRRTAELVARCPPERCNWLRHFIPFPRCPRCEVSHLEATWLRRWSWPHLRVLAAGVASYFCGAGWPRIPPLIHLRCRGCGKEGMTVVTLAERTAILPRHDEVEEPGEDSNDVLWRVLTGGG